MKKIYLLVLVFSTFIINAYVEDKEIYAGYMDNKAKLTHFFPNPATSYINFTFDKSVDKNYSLQVYSFIGRKMNEIRISESKITINLDNNYYRGLYIYQLRDQTGRIVESGKFQVEK